jgi:hypothetical protein
MRELTSIELRAVSGGAMAPPPPPRPVATPPVGRQILAREGPILRRFIMEEEQILARVKTGPEF